MVELIATLTLAAVVCLVVLVLFLVRKASDPLSAFYPIDDNEARLLALVDESFYASFLLYLRTLEMSAGLQDHLSEDKRRLEALSYYMLLRSSQEEEMKKQAWKGETTNLGSTNEHVRRLISQRLKHNRMSGNDV